MVENKLEKIKGYLTIYMDVKLIAIIVVISKFSKFVDYLLEFFLAYVFDMNVCNKG